MNTIKIVTILKIKFSEYYDSKEYKTHTQNKFVIKRYATNNEKIIVGEESK